MRLKLALAIVCILIIRSTLPAGTNDYWQVCLRACAANGYYAQFNCDCGTRPASSDGLDSSDVVAPAALSQYAWISSVDLGPGLGTGYSGDWRAPVTDTAKTWNVKLHVGPAWSKPDVYLRVWNPSGTFDINGSVPICLEIANDPTGTYTPGYKLIECWDPTKNGNQSSPAYTFSFSNATALLGGATIDLRLVAGTSAPIPCTIGEARNGLAGKLIILSAVTASSGSNDVSGLWVSSDGLPGLRVSPGPEVARGEVIDLQGIVTWSDGVPILTNPQVTARGGPSDVVERAMPTAALANDPQESLEYIGINPVGLLCVICGKVTSADADGGFFYLDDGACLADGLGPEGAPHRGVRVVCGTGVSLPNISSLVRVSGIRSVEKHVLERDTIVNGEPRFAAETVYVPVLLVRDASDIVPLAP